MRLALISLLFCLPYVANSQEAISLSINTSADTILLDNAFKIEFITENGEMNDFEPPALNDFDLLQGPSRSMSTSYINGQKSSKASYTYYLKAIKTGKFKVKAFNIIIDGKTYESNSKNIIVIDNPDKLYQDPNTGQIEGYVKKPKKTISRKRFKI